MEKKVDSSLGPAAVAGLPVISAKEFRSGYATGFFEGKGSPSYGAGAAYTASLGEPKLDFYKIVSSQKEALDKSLEDINARKTAEQKRLAQTQREMEISGDVLEYLENSSKVLQTPTGSDFHKLIDADRRGDVFYSNKMVHPGVSDWIVPFAKANVFLIEHDWNSAFQNAEFNEGDFVLPYEICVFEFQVSGRRVLYLTGQNGPPNEGVFFIAAKGGFWSTVDGEPWMENLKKQVRAVCISLDAKVVVTEVTRADEALNAVRLKRNAPPIHDYHVLMLRKQRAAALPRSGDEPTHRIRLHWRRGHWRRLPKHKTWIKWMLVGSPDIGFVDKHYRLT